MVDRMSTIISVQGLNLWYSANQALYDVSMELIVPELVKRNGVTEQLKAENQMEWVRQMNACKAQAEEIVKVELIYD